MNEHLGASSTSAKQKVTEVIEYLLRFVRNPVLSVRNVPSWDWPTVLIFHTSIAAASGILAGIFDRNIMKILGGLILLPITSTVVIAVGSGFFYYTFLFWFRIEVSYRLLFTVMVICSLPFMVLNTLSSLVPPILLIGFLVTGLLLVVALVENFQAPKKHIIQLIGGMFAAYFIFWMINMIGVATEKTKLKTMATQESLEILKKELDEK